MHAWNDLRNEVLFSVPFLIIFSFALLIYFFPLFNIAIHSDVHWLFRLQVADLSLQNSVPEGLKQFAGFPSGLLDGCVAYYQAFGRANCLDVVSFRWLAVIGAGSNNRWLFAYLLFNSAALATLYYILRKLGMGVLLVAILVFGAMLTPSEPWMTPRTSEPKAALMFLAALALTLSSLSGRHWYAAILAACSVMIKEPMVFGWFLVVLVAIGRYLDEKKFGKSIFNSGFKYIVVPHFATALVVIWVYFYFIVYFEKQNDYVFLINKNIPFGAFLTNYWSSLKPLWFKFDSWLFAIPLSVLVFLGLAKRHKTEKYLLPYTRGQILMILGVLVALIGHGLIYYQTNRIISDNRYLVPSNYYFILLLALVAVPLVRNIGQLQLWLVSIFTLAILVYTFNKFNEIRPDQWLLYLLGITLLLPALVYRTIFQHSARSALVTLAAWLVLLPFAALRVDSIYQEAGNARADQKSWEVFVEAVAGLPIRADVCLQFTDPYMIETAWGLQAEMLFRGRSDLNLLLSVIDTTGYNNTNGLLKHANESFNIGKKPIRYDTGGAVMIFASRTGNLANTSPDTRRLDQLINGFLDSPIRWFQERYVQGKKGYLKFTLKTL